MLPIMYVTVGAHFAHLDMGCHLHFCHTAGRCVLVPPQGAEDWLGQSYQSGESQETCGRHGSPASWLQAAHTFCVCTQSASEYGFKAMP